MPIPSDGGSTRSLWADTLADDRSGSRSDGADGGGSEPALPAETEVVVIGAGIAGITTALELVRRGMAVTVLDDGPIGGGETGRTSAHLTSAIDDHYHAIERRHGRRVAAAVAESHIAAIDLIEANVRRLAIDCEFQRVDGYLFGPPGGSDRGTLAREYAAAGRAGLAVERVGGAPLPFATGPALRFAHQAQFHPLAYLRGLAQALVQAGGTLITGARAHVTGVQSGARVTVALAGDRRIACHAAVDASNGALTSPIKLAIEQAAYRSYVLGYDLVPGTIPRALYWDTSDPYHYIRVAPGAHGREVLVVGGGDHRTGQGDPALAFAELDGWVRRWLPIAGAVVARWSGQILEPSDMLAHIGRAPGLDNVYLVSGDSGEGLTYGTIAALLLPDLIQGKPSPWAQVYDPGRSHLRALGTLVREATQSTLGYADWLRPGQASSSDGIAPGEGAVLRRGLHMVACYRDPGGDRHERSATCPHLRGVVRWNAVEKTWDCPCHGSRFDPFGRVLNGPAVSDLGEIGPASADEPRQPPARQDPGSGEPTRREAPASSISPASSEPPPTHR